MDTSNCAKCGTCSTVCPVYRVSGQESDTARGKLHLLGKLAGSPHSPAYREIFSRCLLCGACRHACPRGLDLPGLVAEARSDFPKLTGSGAFVKLLATSCLAHPALLAGLASCLQISEPLLRKLPADSGLRLKLGLLLEPPATSGTEEEDHAPTPNSHQPPVPGTISIFSGCLARHLRPGIAKATNALLATGNQTAPFTPEKQTCCGLATFSAGNPKAARRLARQNLDAFAGGDGPIVTPCGSCYSQLLSYPKLLAADPEYQPRAMAFVARLREMSAFLAAVPASAAPTPQPGTGKTQRVFYHDPCHLRFLPGMKEAPRQLLQSRPGLELVELPDGPRCCGLGGTFNLAHPDLSHRIGATLAEEIITLAPDLVVTSCSGCLIQLHRELAGTGTDIRVTHLVEFLATRPPHHR
jgi:glycolate oxidase iron-sulfur subunit